MFDEPERKILADLFGSDTPMYMHRLSDYARMFETLGATSPADEPRERAKAFLGKLGVLDDVTARDSTERSFVSIDTAILGAGAWSENQSGGEITRIGPAPPPDAADGSAACKGGGEHAFRRVCAKCGVVSGGSE